MNDITLENRLSEEPSEFGRPSISDSGSDDDLPQTELRRDLKERHVNMMAFSTLVGIGLFLQSGKVIFMAGPGLATIAYLLAGSVMWCAISSLGEMSALWPIQGSIFVFPARFLDVGVGYAAGWMSWFAWVVICASEILGLAQLWDFRFDETYLRDIAHYSDDSLGWKVGQDINPAIWVLITLAAILIINCLPVKHYGQLEYIFGCTKMVFITFLIVFNVVVSAKQPVDHGGHGWTYNDPYSFGSQNMTIHNGTSDEVVIGGSTGRFLGMWTSITTVVFSMIGFEAVSISGAESEATQTIKMGTRKICLRVILLYTLSVFVVGFNVPYTDPNLRELTLNAITPGQNSAFILAAVRNNVRGFPHFFNAFFVFSAFTSGVNSLYLSSRILHALASIPEVWPSQSFFQGVRSRLERTTFGVPLRTVFVSWTFGFLAFLAAGPTPSIHLGRMARNSVASMLIVYVLICVTYLQFFQSIQKAAAGQDDAVNNAGIDPQAYNRRSRTYPYMSRGQWAKAAYGSIGCSLLVIFNGWQSFVTPFSAPDFVAAYISIPIFVLIVMTYHIRLDGWDPRGWRRSQSTATRLTYPPPRTVPRTASRSHLQKRNSKNAPPVPPKSKASEFLSTGLNFGQWIWKWIK
ncbi:hypothetical protein HYFRA_00012197 [Hymenoscyphus fraxineus]|uniref:Amino acid permease/ SLC12A domain-containing protein n=1 Tax=Hymenoscyphus fraxineus TaxID=746836 RepID=A0A9N9L331_9HELO|nr:hypothetical protein HYFRA_00012197 [Hymenoscyphus fraxineus]